jgi:mono/diheme cytochrome c family protein
MTRKTRTLALNAAFILVSIAIVLFLLKAPEETTAGLPLDENHQRFHTITSKKEAEKYCSQCHSSNGSAPLPDVHPPEYRCLFCHKRAN